MHSSTFGQHLKRPFLALAEGTDALAELLSQLGGAAPVPKGLDHLFEMVKNHEGVDHRLEVK